MRRWDLIIVGGGPAGLSAGLYAARLGLEVLLLEGSGFGGQIVNALRVENYPGFPAGIGGAELAERMRQQAETQGLVMRLAEVRALEPAEGLLRVVTAGEALLARRVIVASGTRPRRLGVPGEEALLGRGVSTCAVCDGPFFRGRRVAVVGGGDRALQEALHLSELCERLWLIHRRERFRASHVLQERLRSRPNVEFLLGTTVRRILGEGRVEALELSDGRVLEVEGVFVAVGMEPNVAFLPPQVERDEQGFVLTDGALRTSLPGVLAAGDVRSKPLRQAVTAAADGALAAYSAATSLDR